ncbi:terminase small subunit [Alicyclobacillus sp. ALC3]|uniref:terminase small subunit n=1 Tax=Alicyclobacillus sp. ALC3 TaxID=2796143 RepID=UPI002378D1C7|nr:terminase small subunit [Alicyclobacillus sp. ALC3]WDL97812.1 terminase small subunit [Alicyclobacillus sp. ALC3]
MSGKLTPKQQAFVREYLVDLNATQAAIRAGYSQRNADKIASQLLGKTRVSDAISAAMHKREQRTEITQDMVLNQLAKIAFADIKNTVEWDDRNIRIRPSDEVDGTIVQSITQTEIKGIVSKEVKLNDRMRALELLGRHLGMFGKDNVNLNADVLVRFVDDVPNE